MVKTKIKWTNHRDPKKNGKVAEVDESKAKMLIRDGLATAVDETTQAAPATPAAPAAPAAPSAPAALPAVDPVDKPAGKSGSK